eukprot:5749355-Prymnesium_polylepis.1
MGADGHSGHARRRPAPVQGVGTSAPRTAPHTVAVGDGGGAPPLALLGQRVRVAGRHRANIEP